MERLRTGIGIDVHRLQEGEGLWVGGVWIKSQREAVAHSDGDALLHALCDALLSAAGKPDIGHYFPDTDQRWRGAPSSVFVKRVMEMLRGEDWRVVNVSCVVVLSVARLSPYVPEIRRRIGELLNVDDEQVGMTATTAEHTTLFGGQESYAAICSVLIERK